MPIIPLLLKLGLPLALQAGHYLLSRSETRRAEARAAHAEAIALDATDKAGEVQAAAKGAVAELHEFVVDEAQRRAKGNKKKATGLLLGGGALGAGGATLCEFILPILGQLCSAG